MSDDFVVHGAEDFLRLSKALKAAGRVTLRKELTKRMAKAARPLTPKTRAEALQSIPRRGGLAAKVARDTQRVSVKTGATTYGVSLVLSPRRGSGAKLLDTQGAVRHPVFGNPQRFVRQSVPGAKGWFSDTAADEAPSIRTDISDAINSVLNEIVRDARGGL